MTKLEGFDFVIEEVQEIDFDPSEPDVGLPGELFTLNFITSDKEQVSLMIRPAELEKLQELINKYDFKTNKKLQEEFSKESFERFLHDKYDDYYTLTEEQKEKIKNLEAQK